MNLSLIKLDWDSSFFGFEIYKMTNITIDNLTFLKQKHAFCYYESKNIINEEILAKYNGLYINSKVLFFKEIEKIDKKYIDEIDSYETPKYDKDILCKVFINSGKYSRFNMDSRIGSDLFEKLYMQWYENTLNNTFCDKHFILTENKGIISIKLFEAKSSIAIISVNDKYKGKGYGRYLIGLAEAYTLKNNKKIIEVETQLENSKACIFYERCGFKQKEIRNTYHFDFRNENF